MLRCSRLALLAALIPLAAAAQNVSVGSLPQYVSTGMAGNGTFSVVDLSHPATAAGAVNSVSVTWTAGSCSNGFRVKFLRPSSIFGTYSIVAERGPFQALGNTITYALEPSVNLAEGDLIAITQLSGPSCGGIAIAYGRPADAVLTFSGDLSNGTFLGGVLTHGVTPAMQASVNGRVLTDVIPIVGAVSGNFGSQFRTAIQLTNPTAATVSGRLAFHPKDIPGADSDPSIAYSLTAHATQLLPSTEMMFGVGGLGSIDVITSSTAPPLISTRVFSDNGELGTNGFNEDAVAVNDAIGANQSAVITLPEDITNYRMNVGVRSLRNGASVSVTYLQPNGATIASTTRHYSPNLLEHKTVQEFTGSALVANASIVIRVTDGSAIFYSTPTDNRTNDSAIRYAARR